MERHEGNILHHKSGSVLPTTAFSIVISKQPFSSVEEICPLFCASSVSIDRIEEIFGAWSYCYSEVQEYRQWHV